MDIILLERVGKLGHMGDTVRVKDGYARNFLLPRGKALRATEANKKKFEAQRADLEARNHELKRSASEVSTKVDGATVVIIRQAGETGQLYGSVSARDIAEALTAAGHAGSARSCRDSASDQDAWPAPGPDPSASGNRSESHGQRRPFDRAGRASGERRGSHGPRADFDGRSRPRSRPGACRGRSRGKSRPSTASEETAGRRASSESAAVTILAALRQTETR